jgi:hypothetical protein
MAGTPSFTITGKEISGVLAVTNNSPNMIELENPVNFVTYVDVRQNPGVVKFTGGATGVVLPRASNLYGTYNFTVTGNYIEKSGTRVKSGGVYKLLNATFHKHNADFTVDEGARAEVMNAKIQQDTSGKTLLNILDGEFVVTNEFLVSGDGAAAYAKHKVCNGGSGAMVLNSLRVNQIGCLELPQSPIKLILGEGGLIRGKGYVCVGASGVYEIGSYADWSMYYTSLGGYKSTTRYAFYKDAGADTWSDLVFDTTDWYDKSLARTISVSQSFPFGQGIVSDFMMPFTI